MVIVRTPNWLGDVIMSSVAVKKLISIYGGVDVITRSAFIDYWRLLAGVNNVYDLKNWFSLREKYEVGYLFVDSFSSALIFKLMGIKKVYGYSNEFRDFLLDVVLSKKKVHFSKKCMMLVGYWDVDFKDMYFPLVEEYLSFYEELIGKNYIVIAPFSNAPARRWHLKRFIEVMLELDDFFVIVGSSSDAKEFEEYEKYISKKRYKNLIGKTNILQLGAIIKNSKLLITNESGVMHIAACFDTPCVVISGPSDRNLTGVFGSSVVILQANLKCVPCVKNYCYRIGRGFMECMNLITLKDVLNAIKKLI